VAACSAIEPQLSQLKGPIIEGFYSFFSKTMSHLKGLGHAILGNFV